MRISEQSILDEMRRSMFLSKDFDFFCEGYGIFICIFKFKDIQQENINLK